MEYIVVSLASSAFSQSVLVPAATVNQLMMPNHSSPFLPIPTQPTVPTFAEDRKHDGGRDSLCSKSRFIIVIRSRAAEDGGKQIQSVMGIHHILKIMYTPKAATLHRCHWNEKNGLITKCVFRK